MIRSSLTHLSRQSQSHLRSNSTRTLSTTPTSSTFQTFYSNYVKDFKTGNMSKIATDYFRPPIAGSFLSTEFGDRRLTLDSSKELEGWFNAEMKSLIARGYTGNSIMNPISIKEFTSKAALVTSEGKRYRGTGELMEGIKGNYVAEYFEDIGDWRFTSIFIEAIAPVEGENEMFTSAVKVTDLKQKNVLVLGSGLVASSCSEYLGRTSNRSLTIAGNNQKEVTHVASKAKHSQTKEVVFDVANDDVKLASLIKESDAVISLLPVNFHTKVAEMCIDSGVDMVTASYVSPAMRALGGKARERGVTILNEVGLDPGMDHMSAQRIMDDVKRRGGKITSFSSVCGGLPAPEAANNPLMYKFSWAPRGVLNASGNPASYLKDGIKIDVSGEEMLGHATPINSFKTMNLECLPNRDSLIYVSEYGIQDAHSIFRGTLRYAGSSSLLYGVKKFGLMDDVPVTSSTWDQVINDLLRKTGESSIESALAKYEKADGKGVVDCLHWLNMTNNSGLKVTQPNSLIGSFCDLLETRLTYGPNERDMVAMNTDIYAEFGDGSMEYHKSSLLAFGDANMTAMCKTVGYTAAIGTELVLNGSVKEKGVLTPMREDVYKGSLYLLEEEGLGFDETCSRVEGKKV